MPRSDQIKLGAFLVNGGHHLAAWRHPLATVHSGLDFGFYKQLAQTAERGKLDAIFIADVVGLWGKDLEALSRTTRGEHFEPVTLLSALGKGGGHWSPPVQGSGERRLDFAR
jgi:alkanesulfonate monooxygenase SsuD/methylene tetrahydromethanopterin reductase-like flavin-dependent oxidoreductase (luciferase family)